MTASATWQPHCQRPSNYLTEMCSGSEAGSYLRLIDVVSFNSRLENNQEEEEETKQASTQTRKHAAIQSTSQLTNQPSTARCRRRPGRSLKQKSLSLSHTHTHSLSLTHTHTLPLSLTHTHTHSLSLTHTHGERPEEARQIALIGLWGGGAGHTSATSTVRL